MRHTNLVVRTRLILGASVVCAAVASLTACSAESETTGLSADAVAERYGYRATESALSPVYALVPQFRDPADGYARDLLARQCLQDIVEYTPVVPGASGGFKDERTGQWVLDEPTAQASGYPYLRPKDGPVGGVPDDVVLTDATLAEMERCGVAADERLGTPPARLLNDIEATGWFAATDSPDMADVIGQWRECMVPLGLADLPEDPTLMPPRSVINAVVDAESEAANGGYGAMPLTDREREVAVSDAKCLAQVDYYGIQNRVRAEAELSMIGENLKEFEAVRREYETYQRGVDAVIAELG
ncbi:hypothetical protein Xcel_0026 [Xylanimonas cellulosilytica DSM 15894]|uniref:Secreted protein n=2 Tax=Xylanimonas TaxID=186188 RepID=D1BTC5_XYLCX|nr:hypothetical protein Xcel_0026 [Xylanimonas cellulosilytica DSM 15894]